jgi:hypothetical protein
MGKTPSSNLITAKLRCGVAQLPNLPKALAWHICRHINPVIQVNSLVGRFSCSSVCTLSRFIDKRVRLAVFCCVWSAAKERNRSTPPTSGTTTNELLFYGPKQAILQVPRGQPLA